MVGLHTDEDGREGRTAGGSGLVAASRTDYEPGPSGLTRDEVDDAMILLAYSELKRNRVRFENARDNVQRIHDNEVKG